MAGTIDCLLALIRLSLSILFLFFSGLTEQRKKYSNSNYIMQETSQYHVEVRSVFGQLAPYRTVELCLPGFITLFSVLTFNMNDSDRKNIVWNNFMMV